MSTEKKNESKAMSLHVTTDLQVTVLPDNNHEFLMDMKEVAMGYGTTEYAIRQTKVRNQSELIEGKHFVSAVTIRHSSPSAPHNKVFWTKRGIVRLGFFIKSQRARLFRDWAEDLILSRVNQPVQTDLFGCAVKQLPEAKRRHNRLSPQRLVDILADVAMIDDRQLRESLISKLVMKGGA